MIKHIYHLPGTEEWCDHCGKRCNIDERFPYLIKSDNPEMKDMVLCKACLDLALNEQQILPEEF